MKVVVVDGMRVSRRPDKSPTFQKRKASGTKLAGSKMREVDSGGWTLIIDCEIESIN